MRNTPSLVITRVRTMRIRRYLSRAYNTKGSLVIWRDVKK